MSHYYYFIASLPTLQFGVKPLLNLAQFVKEAEQFLSPQDFSELQKALNVYDISDKPQNPVVHRWVEFERQLRNELAWFRAIEANKDPSLYIRGERGADAFLVDVVATASKAENPLAAERVLDGARWQKLETMQQFHYFDMDYLIAYALQLRILERYQEIASPKGKELFAEYKKIEIPALN